MKPDLRSWSLHDSIAFARPRRRAGCGQHRPSTTGDLPPMTARPSSYTPELADRILAELRAGRSVREICRDSGMPCRDTLFEWIRQDRDGFGGRYRQARQIG